MTERREPATEAGLSDSMKLRVLAAWFDRFDDWREATGKIAPGISDYREVQNDLRRIADAIEREATDARVAALEEALRTVRSDGFVASGRTVNGERLAFRTANGVPMEIPGERARRRIEAAFRLLSDLPAEAAERLPTALPFGEVSVPLPPAERDRNSKIEPGAYHDPVTGAPEYPPAAAESQIDVERVIENLRATDTGDETRPGWYYDGWHDALDAVAARLSESDR